MTVFDGRHRWGPPDRNGSLITRTCRVCGLKNSAETLLPDSVIETLIEAIRRPNPYRQAVMAQKLRSEGVRPLRGPLSCVRSKGRLDSAALSRKVVTTS